MTVEWAVSLSLAVLSATVWVGYVYRVVSHRKRILDSALAELRETAVKEEASVQQLGRTLDEFHSRFGQKGEGQ